MSTHLEVGQQVFDWGAPDDDPLHGHAWIRQEGGLQVAACERRSPARRITYRGSYDPLTTPCQECVAWLEQHRYPVTGYIPSRAFLPGVNFAWIFGVLIAIALLVSVLSIFNQ